MPRCAPPGKWFTFSRGPIDLDPLQSQTSHERKSNFFKEGSPEKGRRKHSDPTDSGPIASTRSPFECRIPKGNSNCLFVYLCIFPPLVLISRPHCTSSDRLPKDDHHRSTPTTELYVRRMRFDNLATTTDTHVRSSRVHAYPGSIPARLRPFTTRPEMMDLATPTSPGVREWSIPARDPRAIAYGRVV